MVQQRSGWRGGATPGAQLHFRDLSDLSRRILEWSTEIGPKGYFLRRVSGLLLEFSGCEQLSLKTRDGHLAYHWEAHSGPAPSMSLEISRDEPSQSAGAEEGRSNAIRLCQELLGPEDARTAVEETPHGSRWRPDSAVIPFPIDVRNWGAVVIRSPRRGPFTLEAIEFYEAVGQIVGLALAHRRAAMNLHERVKELTCLYGIARHTSTLGASFEEMLSGIVQLLPPAWQYPEIACARVLLDGRSYCSAGFREGPHRLATDIVVEGEPRGEIEIFYREDRPDLGLRPFLEEERALLDMVAQELSRIVQHKQAKEERSKLENQLHHADRLATIGQLSAGVAHELNEPLNGIIGFAQLGMKAPDLPAQTGRDIERILKAALHAREVVRKLMLFSRQIPPRPQRVDLNQVVRDGLYFLESRCANAAISLHRELATECPPVEADPSQLNQVLVNLVVNAIQAMPDGGQLTVRTGRDGSGALLVVEDTGTGMTEEVKRRVFTPFFTTKEVGQGTGLGLAVVHGIVRSHGGSICVDTAEGRGTRFEVRLPGLGHPEPKEVPGA